MERNFQHPHRSRDRNNCASRKLIVPHTVYVPCALHTVQLETSGRTAGEGRRQLFERRLRPRVSHPCVTGAIACARVRHTGVTVRGCRGVTMVTAVSCPCVGFVVCSGRCAVAHCRVLSRHSPAQRSSLRASPGHMSSILTSVSQVNRMFT